MKAASSYRTKRRKIQQEIEILGNLLDVNLSNSLEPQFNISPGIPPIQKNITSNESQINNSASNTFNFSKKNPSEDASDSALCSLIDARSFAKDNSEVSSNENYVFEENQKNRNKSTKRSYAGSSKEFIVPKLPTVSSGVQHTLLNLTLIKKKNSRSNSEIDEVLECVSDKKLKVTRDTPSFKTARCLAYGTPTNNHYENENENDQAFKKIITRSLTCMKYEIEGVQKRLDSMASLLEKMYDKIENPSISSLNNINNLISDIEIIAIEDNESLDVIEERLTNDKPFRTQMVLALTRLMGDSISETVRRIMQKLFTDKFLSNHSLVLRENLNYQIYKAVL
ncbi:hypothetical protein ACI65C_001208 [Semiaphis heraclei]